MHPLILSVSRNSCFFPFGYRISNTSSDPLFNFILKGSQLLVLCLTRWIPSPLMEESYIVQMRFTSKSQNSESLLLSSRVNKFLEIFYEIIVYFYI
uniref:Uncharacterized protein n=1 Tax=Lepeophtheirus salmonis TaxID=72036 RepID=A0A0K2U854_LEPSM